MSWCLIPARADEFKQKILSGEIDPLKLNEMTSEERHKFFADQLGEENAGQVNSLFENKLLLKNQQLGMVNWAKQLMGLKPEVKQDIFSRIERLDKVLDPATEKEFLSDLAKQKLGVDVSFDEAKKITSLSKNVVETRNKITTDMPNGSPERLDYGLAKVALQNYVNDLKLSNNKTDLKEYLNPLKAIEKISGIAKGIQASTDNSLWFRQMWKTIFTNPDIWAKNFAKSWGDIVEQLKSKGNSDDILNGVKAEIFSRKNSLNGLYQKAKLDIGMSEEAFPATLPEKIPVLGKIYKASEVAYSAGAYRMRADIFDKYIDIAEKSGVDLRDNFEVKSIGTLVNSLTGRGSLGSLEKVGKTTNVLFFSPKMLKSNIDTLTVHAFDKMSSFARKQAAINTLKAVFGTAFVLGTIKAFFPNAIETDPRSSDFGKAKIKDTRFDLSGGMSSIFVLASRILSSSSKSSTTGKINKLNSGAFGSQTTSDIIWSFLENKFSPGLNLLKDLSEQKDFNGKPITLGGEIFKFSTPLSVQNAQELLSSPNSAPALLGILTDTIGLNTNTYSAQPKAKSGYLKPKTPKK